MTKDPEDTGNRDEERTAYEALEQALQDEPKRKFVLRLYVAGTTPNSLKAIRNIRNLCSKHLGECDLEIIDIYQQPIFAKNGQIVAAPTLVKELPPPLRRFIGSMSDTDKILLGLDVRTEDKPEEADERKNEEH